MEDAPASSSSGSGNMARRAENKTELDKAQEVVEVTEVEVNEEEEWTTEEEPRQVDEGGDLDSEHDQDAGDV